MNYGHKLEFGTFITPKSATPDHVVALAKRSEDLGYTLVSFQDHPYQPALLDTWTLLSWVAGKTERIQIAPNVLNLPLRPPIMIAHAAASLDLLSNGRVSLGLGAGAFWDPVVPHLEPHFRVIRFDQRGIGATSTDCRKPSRRSSMIEIDEKIAANSRISTSEPGK